MDPSSSRHHDQAYPHPLLHHHHNLCNTHNHGTNSNNLSMAPGPLLGGPSGLSAALPHQLSQLCSSQHPYPLLALQQNFNHLLPPNFPSPQQFNQLQSQLPNETSFRTQRNPGNNHHNHHHHSHNHDQNATHHQRSHHNWRKSKAQTNSKSVCTVSSGAALSLLDLSAKIVAEHIPFQSIERRYEHIPEPVQRQIIFWSFPRHEDDIKMYSSLSSDTFSTNATTSSSTTASSSTSQSPSSNTAFMWVEQSAVQANTQTNQPVSNLKSSNKFTFNKGLKLYDEGCVQDALQVGFNLSGTINIRVSQINQLSNNPRARNVVNGNINTLNNNDFAASQNQVSTSDGNPVGETQITKCYRVSVTFDRCKITSVSCSCELQDIFWCEHVVALIIYRIRNPETIDLRVPISETLSSLDRQQLQKLVQYIIAEHHTEVLPTAQRLLDEMRQSFSEINQIQGAPDPTAGASSDDEHIWHLDENQVNEKVQNYLNLASSSSKEAFKQINALFEKIREMFRAKDSNGTRLLRLITEQFLLYAIRNDKSRSLWDQLVFLWVVVMLNPDLPTAERAGFAQLLTGWSKATKCPKEDVERRVSLKRSTTEVSDDDDSDDCSSNSFYNELNMSLNRSNNYPAHMATHRRNFHHESGFPVLRPYNQLSLPSSACPCQVSRSMTKKMRISAPGSEQAGSSSRNFKPSGSSSNHSSRSRSGLAATVNENRPAAIQEPRSVFHRALDFRDSSWDDPHLQMILNKDGPIDFEASKNIFVDFAGNPLWNEPISQSAARIETLRSYGYREQSLRLTVATVRRLKLQQDQWCMVSAPDSDIPVSALDLEVDSEGWIGHPFDPINVMLDILLSASLTEPNISDNSHTSGNICSLNASACACPYNQVLVDFTNKLLPDLASLSYQHRNNSFPLLPLVNLPTRRVASSPTHNSSDKTPFFHVPVPGCCQKDSYLTLGVELALIALGQQRSIPTVTTAHERAVRQESELISKLESIDTSDPLLIEILKHQTTLILEGGPFQNSCCGVTTDSAPLHTFATYLFESLVPHYSQLAYKIGVYALKMPLVSDENTENYGAARTSPRSINYNHLQSEQLVLAQTMLSRAKEEKQFESFLRKVYRASVKNIRNPSNLHKLSKHVLKEAKTSVTSLQPPVYRAVLQTAFDLGLQVLKITQTPHSSNSKTRREAILFIVECATDMGLDSVIQVMKDARENFSATEALNLVVSRDSDPVNNLRSQAISKLKLKDCHTDEARLNRRSRDLALECAVRDPTNCALEAIKFCQVDEESLKRALKIVIDSGTNRSMDSTQLIKVADHIHENMNMTDRAFDIAMVAVDSLTIPPNSDNSSSKKDIFSACEYASKVDGFSVLIPKLLKNIECATVLSEIYHRFSPSDVMGPAYRHYAGDVAASYRGINYNKEYNTLLNNLNPEIYKSEIYKQKIYKQKLEDAGWWDALLKRTMTAFDVTAKNRLLNISPRHYGEFIDFLVKAQGIFEKAADGPKQFEVLLAYIVKKYRTKKKLMEKLKLRFELLHITGKL